MGRRTVLLIAALVVAALGTTLVFAYVHRTDERALKDQAPVDVLVAKTLIRAGTTGSGAEANGAFKLQHVPRASTVPGYLTSTREIRDLVAVSDIYPGEQIIPQKFAPAGAAGALPIPGNKIAMSFQLGDPQRVAGFVKPGADIAIFMTANNIGPTRNGAGTRLLLPKIGVIAIGPTTLRPASGTDANKETVPTAILTLAVDQVQGEKIVLAQSTGQLWFALVTKDSRVAPDTGVDGSNLFR